MIRYLRWSLCLTAALLFAFITLPGCNTAKDGKKSEVAAAKDKDTKDEHDHGETGPHGGPLIEWDDYHGEFIVKPEEKLAILYILDEKMKHPSVDPSRFSKVRLVITNVQPAVYIDFKFDPVLTKDMGLAFVGKHDHLGTVGEIKGDIGATLAAEVKGGTPKRYDKVFRYEPPKADKDKNKATKLRELYLTPGGIYTAADIKANGNTTAAEKLKGKIWLHDDDLKVGDKICPVTKKKAEAECAWTVQGQRYQFCCQPCIDNFVIWAHNQPNKVKDAGTYVYKGM